MTKRGEGKHENKKKMGSVKVKWKDEGGKMRTLRQDGRGYEMRTK